MLGVVEDVVYAGAFDNATQIHDGHLIAHLRHHTHVVCNKHDGRAVLGLQVAHQFQNLRFSRHIQRGGRLVGDQQHWRARQRHGDHGALPHATRKLMRVRIGNALRVGHTDLVEDVNRAPTRLFFILGLMQQDSLFDLHANGEHRIERGHRLLEDHRDVVAANGTHLIAVLVQAQNIDRFIFVSILFEEDLAAFVFANGRGELHDSQASLALAAARLADDAQHLAAWDVETNAVERPHRANGGVEVHLQILYADHIIGCVEGIRLRRVRSL